MLENKKTFLKHFASTFTAIAIFIGIVSFFIATNTGLQWLISGTIHILPGNLNISKIEGSLNGPITLENITYKNTKIQLSIKKLDFDWHLSTLLLSRLHLTRFNLETANIKYTDTSRTTTLPKFKLPTPIKLHIDQGSIQKITITYNDTKPIIIDSLNFSAKISPKKIKYLQTKVTAQNSTFLLQIQNNIHWQWQLNIADLAGFFANTKGSIVSNGNLELRKNNLPIVTAKTTINNLHFGSLTLESLNNQINTSKKVTTHTPPPPGLTGGSKNKIKHQNTGFPVSTGNDGEQLHFILNTTQLTSQGITLPKFSAQGEFKKYDHQNHLITHYNAFEINFGKIGKLQNLKINGNTINIIFGKKTFILKGSLALNKLSPAIFEFKFPNYNLQNILNGNQHLKGFLTWQSSNFTFLNPLFTQLKILKDLSGKLQLRAKVTGIIAKPHLTGNLYFANGSLNLPLLNLDLRNINLATDLKDNSLHYTAKLRSGTGTLNLKGIFDYSGKTPLANGKIYGENFLAANTKEYKIQISPTLQFNLSDNKLNVTGNILIPYARIRPTDFSGSTTMPPETYFVHQKTAYEKMGHLPIISKIKLVLGDNVKINVMDLRGKITGDVTITDNSQSDATAVGSFKLGKDAYYNLYGQHLQIREGRMFYTGGPVMNPSLSIEAIHIIKNTILPQTNKQIEKLVVGIRITGHLENLVTEFFSEPTGLNTTDILSYLVLGQPSGEVSKDNTQILFRVANALNFGGSSHSMTKLIKNMKSHLGLSELTLGTEKDIVAVEKYGRITSEITTHTALMLGKYLTPNLYIGYSLGLTEAINIFRIRYYFKKHWSIQSESSTEGNGVDILYSIERD